MIQHTLMRLAPKAAVLALAAACAVAAAQSFPSRPITIVVPYTPGGSADALARNIGEQLGKRLGQPVVIDNKPGAGTLLGTQVVARAAPDGHTLLLSASVLTVQPAVNKAFTIDPERDLAPVTEAVRGIFLIAANPGVAAGNVRELAAQSKARPDSVAYGTPGLGSSPHLTAEYLKGRLGGSFLHVPYKGSSLALNATLAGEVQFMIDPIYTLKPQVDAGKLKALAVTGAARSPLLPNVPTVAESGVPGFEVTYWIGFFAPAGTPAAVVSLISSEMAAVLREPEMTRKLNAQGFDVVGGTPAELAGRVKSELALWKAIVVEQKLKFE